MITPIGSLSIWELLDRKDDLLVSSNTIKKLARAEREKAIDEFVKALDSHCGYYKGENKNITRDDVLKIAQQLKEGGK